MVEDATAKAALTGEVLMVDVPLTASLADTDASASARAQRDIAARMERLPLTRTQVKARIVVGTATFFDGYDCWSSAW